MFWLLTAAMANPVQTVEGPRPARDLWVSADARRAPLVKCFNGSEAEILLVLTIESDGLVSNAQFRTNDNPDPAVTRCLVSESLRMRTPKRAADEPKSVFKWTVSPSLLGAGVPIDLPPPGSFEVRGALDKAAVEDKFGSFGGHFRYCFSREKTRDPNLSGSFDVHATVDAEGMIQTVTVLNNTFPHERVGECVADKFRSIRFDKPADGRPVLIARPFTFE